MQKATKQSIDIYWANIYTNGRKDVTHQLLMNIMLKYPASDMFLDSNNMTKNKKTKTNNAIELRKFLNKVGPNTMT